MGSQARLPILDLPGPRALNTAARSACNVEYGFIPSEISGQWIVLNRRCRNGLSELLLSAGKFRLQLSLIGIISFRSTRVIEPVHSATNGSSENVLDASSFPLVPYESDSRWIFPLARKEMRLEPNMTGDPVLHGQGWLSAWQKWKRGPTAV
jgi:hypothetical protein